MIPTDHRQQIATFTFMDDFMLLRLYEFKWIQYINNLYIFKESYFFINITYSCMELKVVKYVYLNRKYGYVCTS